MNKSILLKLRHVIGSCLLLCLLSTPGFGQTRSVSGTVKDDGGQSVPGVNIVVKGTSNGAITDTEGKYSIQAASSDVLVFSFVGYTTQEITVGSQSVIDVALAPDVTALQEVVVTGYGSERKADLTGAVAVVQLDAVRNNATGNPMQALQGRVPGLYIEKNGGAPNGENSRILIRGANTLGNTDPLYVIDGVPTKRAEVFQSLPASSIESVQVLKDASAASIYGSRASNGVIIVTTKDGGLKGGESLSITVNSSFSHLSTKPQRVDMLSAEERGRVLWRGAVNDKTNPTTLANLYTYNWNGDFNNPVLSGVTPSPITVANTANLAPGDTDWQDVSYDAAQLWSNDVSIAASSANSSLLINVGYVKNTGTFVNTDYERYSARINANTRFFKNRLKIGMNSEVSTSNETGVSTDLGNSPNTGQAVTLAPTIPVYLPNGQFAGPGTGYSDRNNPVGMQFRNRWDNLAKSFIFGNLYVDAEPVKNLVFRSSLGYDFSNALNKNIELAFQEGFLSRQVNSLLRSTTNQLTLIWSNTARYTIQKGQSTINFLAGVEAIKNDRDAFSSFREGFSSQTEDFFYINAGVGRAVVTGAATGNRLLSQFGKINYSLADKYLASVTVRRDGSSRFGEDNRYGVFPAISVGWRIANEAFMKDITIISDLKLRAGYGVVGNQDISNQDGQGVSDQASLALYEPRYGTLFNNGAGFPGQWLNIGTAYDLRGANGGTLPSGFVSVQAANPILKWEQTKELNVGLDFSLMDDKLFGSFDYFTREISGILIQPVIAATVGEGQLKWLNGATKENKGFEFIIGYRGKAGDFTYNVSGNLARSRDKITELPSEVRANFPGNVEKTILGHSNLSFFGYRSDGLFQTADEVAAHATQPGKGVGRIRYKDLNSDGIINALDQDWLGTALPGFEYGIRIDVGYKNFDLSIFGSGIAGRVGTDPYGVLANRIDVRNNNSKGILEEAWSPQNTGGTRPMLSLIDANAENRASDFFIVNTSYFKMRTVQLGYTLPSDLLKKARIQSLRVFAMGDNVFWLKPNGIAVKDPEMVGLNQVPVPTAYSFGLNVTFN